MGEKMTRLELYHQKTKQFSWKGPFFFILIFILLTVGFYVGRHFYQSTIKIESPEENLGSKVVIHLPDGKAVFTYENYIIEKDGKTYYKGERNTIDLTGGTVTYENWE
jgi:hypothetical protein